MTPTIRRCAARTKVCLAAAALVLASTPMVRAGQDGQALFRSGTDAVSLDVSARRQNRPVLRLEAKDFELLDNGVRQTIADVSYEKLPIDVTIALDVSASVGGTVLAELRRSVLDLKGRLLPGDRLELIGFNMRVARLADVTTTSAAMGEAIAKVAGAGSTSIFDTIAVALAAPAPASRRQLLVVFSDGHDSSSVTTPADLVEVAKRTTPTLAMVLPSSRADVTPLRQDRPNAVPLTFYEDLTRETGGLVIRAFPGDDLSAMFRRVLDDFRTSYVLRFEPTGVARSGFHALEVRVKQPGVDVRTRRGYLFR